jgi:hypothetical protein
MYWPWSLSTSHEDIVVEQFNLISISHANYYMNNNLVQHNCLK